jgi:hypothetical protein
LMDSARRQSQSQTGQVPLVRVRSLNANPG